jgi:hypothetical protein
MSMILTPVLALTTWALFHNGDWKAESYNEGSGKCNNLIDLIYGSITNEIQ